MGLAQKLFGTQSSKEIKRIMPLVHKIEGLRSQMMELSDEELRGKTMEFKIAFWRTARKLTICFRKHMRLSARLPRRVLKMEHYEVQIIGGIIPHQGRIAEMRTGEGKTLVSTLPAYLNALEGQGRSHCYGK